MTNTDDDYLNRQRTINDEKLWTLDLFEMSLVPPDGVGIFDEPTRCYTINKQWAKIVMGAVSAQLLSIASWKDATDEDYPPIRSIQEFLRGDSCACSIYDLLEDDEFYEDEYLPQTFGDYYSDTVANETAQAAAYDGTPQSIGADIPTGTPNTAEKPALCAAVHRFVALYASTKLCLIQSKNFLEILWTKIANAANNFYDAVVSLMSPIYSPNIFSCFISDAAAITALQDDGAIETLACHIYDELKTVTMSQANFDAAIMDAATTLTGNAGDIACLMLNDNNQSLYINLLEGYQIALQQNAPDCPCESQTFWMIYRNLAVQNDYRITYGTKVASGIQTVGTPLTGTPTQSRMEIAIDELGGSFAIRAAAMIVQRQGSIGNGTNDYQSFRGFSLNSLQGTQNAFAGGGFYTDAASNVAGGTILGSPSLGVRSFSVTVGVDGAPSGSNFGILKEYVVYGNCNAGNVKPAMAVYVPSIPPTVPALFP